MEQELLRKVQLTLLEIAVEIKRVCEENDIRFFLSDGSFLGAVRHQGFIPWDDDMDMGMLRTDYEKFCRIAPKALKPEYCLEVWNADSGYGLPFAKVMKRNTVYLESKKNTKMREKGFYIDIFPFDNAPCSQAEQQILVRKLTAMARTMLMKCGYQPWMDQERILWKKRIGYLYYQLRALCVSHGALARAYDALAVSFPESDTLLEQSGRPRPTFFRREWCESLASYAFEGVTFPGPKDYDAYLTTQYGDYMTPPPEGSRENRHQIIEIDFGEKRM